MIRIVHSRASGTLLFGAGRDDAPGLVIASAQERWWFYPALGTESAWYLTNSRGHRVRRDAIDRLAAALRAAGHEVEVTTSMSLPVTSEETDQPTHTGDVRLAVVPPGEPVVTGQYAALLTRLRQADITHPQHAIGRSRLEAITSTRRNRNQPRSIMRRIQRLETDLDHWQHTRAALGPTVDRSGSDSGELAEANRRIAEVTDELEFWRAELTTSQASGVFRCWTPDDFRPGDQARIIGVWYPVIQVNLETLTLGLPSHEDDGRHLDEHPAPGTHTAAYVVYGRRRDKKQLHNPPPTDGASCTCPASNAYLSSGREDGPCAERAVLRLTIHHDGATCGCNGACRLDDSDTPALADWWTEVVLLCTSHAYQSEAVTVATLTAGTATIEDLS